MAEKILVTGSTGFIGSRMVQTLLSEHYSVRVLLRPESSSSSGQSGGPGAVEAVRAGYGDQDALARAVEGVDRIVHLAGVTKAVDELGFIDGNVRPVENLLAAVRKSNPDLKRFLLVSSLAAAGPALAPQPGVRESDKPAPVSAYGRSKLMGELAARERAGEVPLTIVRPPAVYGPGDRDILEVFRMMRKGVLVSAGSGKKQRFSMIHVDDLVRGIMMALRSRAAIGQTYFLTSTHPYSWDEVIDAARPVLGFRHLFRIGLPAPLVFGLGNLLGATSGLTGKPALINSDKANELTQDYWTCSGSKALRELGFTPSITLREGVATTLQWYQRKGWL